MISIIIIVKNDTRIEKLLASLQLTTKPQPTEVIVVDASKGSLDFIKEKFSFVTWIDYESSRQRTYSQQRNIGILHAKGEYIVFIDADCIPEKSWLVSLLNPIVREHENIVSGACRPLGKSYIHKEEQYGRYREECETMNFAMTKEVIATIGLFDERLEGCEDSDFCIRAGKAGYKIRYEKNAVIYHDWGNIRKELRRAFDAGRDRAQLYKKHTQHLKSVSINNIYTLYYILYMLFLPIAFFYPVYVFVVFLPSIIKRRNPIKEFFNISYVLGFIKQSMHIVFSQVLSTE